MNGALPLCCILVGLPVWLGEIIPFYEPCTTTVNNHDMDFAGHNSCAHTPGIPEFCEACMHSERSRLFSLEMGFPTTVSNARMQI